MSQVAGVRPAPIVIRRYDLAGQKVRHTGSLRAREAEVETLKRVGFGRERGAAVLQALSRLAWTA